MVSSCYPSVSPACQSSRQKCDGSQQNERLTSDADAPRGGANILHPCDLPPAAGESAALARELPKATDRLEAFSFSRSFRRLDDHRAPCSDRRRRPEHSPDAPDLVEPARLQPDPGLRRV